MILGTAAYMSPEQATGREADKRSDIWAFGCVLYEMLTGTRAFDGEDMTDVLGAVVRLEPKWEAVPGDVSPALRTLIQRCLAKDRRERVSDVSAVKFVLSELQNLVASHVPAPAVAAPRPRWRRAGAAAVTTMLAALFGAAVTWTLRPSPTPPVVAQFSVPLPEGQFFTTASQQIVAVSADGTRLAYVANRRLYVRSISEPESRAVPRTDPEAAFVTLPMFAPDGQSIAFVQDGDLMRIPLTGGVATTIVDGSAPCGASWDPDGGRNGIWRVSPSGGVPELLVEFPNDEAPCSPHLLPGGRSVLFTLNKDRRGFGRAEIGQWDNAQVVAQSLSDGTRHVLMEGSDARYLPTGHLLYSIAGTMHAVPFDADRITLTGRPVPVIQGVTRSAGEQTSATQAAVSQSGTLVYLPGPATTAATTFSLLVGDQRSDPVPLAVPPGEVEQPRVSPDGTMLALGRNDRGRSDIWLYDPSGKTAPRPLTIGGRNRYPIWSSDGRRVTFQSGREGDEAIFSQPVDGNAAVRVTTPAKGEMHVPEAWSPDGRYLLYSAGKTFTLRTSLEALRVDDGTTTRLATGLPGIPVRGATFSPDGRWVAYSSDEDIRGASRSPTERDPGREIRGVFVEPFPPTGQRIPAPKELNRQDFHPVWARDGQRLFFSRFPQRLVAVPFSTQPPTFGLPIELARTPPTGIGIRDARGYDVFPDGRVVSLSPLIGSSPAAPQGEIRVVLNWFEELKRLVPVK